MFYLIIFVILAFLATANVLRAGKPGNRLIVGLAALILILVAGLRYETGGDWDNYTYIFYCIPPLNHLDIFHYHSTHCEIGFTLLCALIKWMGGNVQALFLTITTINICLITAALCKYTKYPVLGLLCYYGILYFSLEMIYIRQAMTVAICFWAIHCIQDRQPFRYIFWVIVACLIHRMAIVMILLYPVIRLKIPAWIYALVIGVGAITMFVNFTWITDIFTRVTTWLGGGYAEKARVYTEAGMFSVNRKISIGFTLNLLIFAVVLFFKKKIDSLKYGTIHLNMFALSLVLYYYCYELVEVSNRFRLFFLISVVALLPLLVEVMENNLTKLISTIIIYLYCFSFGMNIFMERRAAIAYNPYQNYIVYRSQNKVSTGKVRLEQSHMIFRNSRHN